MELGLPFATTKPVMALYDAAHGVSRFLVGMIETYRAAPVAVWDERQASEMLRDALARNG